MKFSETRTTFVPAHSAVIILYLLFLCSFTIYWKTFNIRRDLELRKRNFRKMYYFAVANTAFTLQGPFGVQVSCHWLRGRGGVNQWSEGSMGPQICAGGMLNDHLPSQGRSGFFPHRRSWSDWWRIKCNSNINMSIMQDCCQATKFHFGWVI